MVEAAEPTYESRLRGCLLGGALGDALGAPLEFMSLSEIHQEYGPAGLTAPPDQPLDFTDDTQMTLFTAEGLIRIHSQAMDRGTADTHEVLDHAYHRWLRTQDSPTLRWDSRIDDSPGWLLGVQGLHRQAAPGQTCLSLATNSEIGRLGESALNNSKGCGTVMRVAPVGFFTPPSGPDDYDLFDLGCISGFLTHGHPSGYLAAGALAYLLEQIRAGITLRMALAKVESRLAQEDAHDEVLEALQQAQTLERTGHDSSPDEVESLGGGWVAEEALAIAVYCALAAERSDDPWTYGTLLAVNHSGDSDSTGAIAGNLLGAIHGEQVLPGAWLEQLSLAEVVSELADDFISTCAAEPPTDFRSKDWMQRYPPN